ncbi:AAA family ATPase [Lishizhenia sp.]|uniref:AAA family ATPase n=1 Tax=Lishizhenia sp. TaxID=2497594 RepID=UPI00299DD16A|nr:AAA family ATPase [Lishizhenia sp.]MDX1446856.1 sigma 54-interacting transcriptional regulator [Lishizhenia sp.]
MKDIVQLKTLGDLKAVGYKTKPIKDELRDNLIAKIKAGETVFKGIHGYENTVIPQLENAILAKHNINFLGLRGQAKTRLARLMVDLLDEYIPIIEGSEINDDPFAPLSRYGKEVVAKQGDLTPISWLHRSDRFAEKLATPDVTVADIIGDVDPIKAANLKLSYADDRVIHFGMIPRANRCIFVINEIPDLQARIQVALFNILQEGDIQIRGFKLRLPLDMQFIFTANPEDYTNRGSIVTPLKDRIGSQILTHYPKTMEVAKRITAQEVEKVIGKKEEIHINELARQLVEQISFEARKSDFVDEKSGVSARLSITALQNLIASAERRMFLAGDATTAIRLSDFLSIIPAITGKVELVYEGEQEGAAQVAEYLIGDAILSLSEQFFPKISNLEKPGVEQWYQKVVNWFVENDAFELTLTASNDEYASALNRVTPLEDILKDYQPNVKKDEDKLFLKELILWMLVEKEKLSKSQQDTGYAIKDNLGDFLKM